MNKWYSFSCISWKSVTCFPDLGSRTVNASCTFLPARGAEGRNLSVTGYSTRSGRLGTSAMPQRGQYPAWEEWTSGCIGHTKSTGASVWAAFAGAMDDDGDCATKPIAINTTRMRARRWMFHINNLADIIVGRKTYRGDTEARSLLKSRTK